MLSESERERQTSHSIIYMYNLKRLYKRAYLQNRTRLTGIENKLMVTKAERREEGRGKLGI